MIIVAVGKEEILDLFRGDIACPDVGEKPFRGSAASRVYERGMTVEIDQIF